MNLKEIKEILNLMNENELSELEIEREGAKIKIKKASAEGPGPDARAAVEYPLPAAPAAPPAEPAPAAPASASKTKNISSPMVGTFYRAPAPEAPPFVEIGSMVEVGQVVCIVEAMKLMNEIKSEIKGKIVDMPVANAEPVEFGQPLFIVEPA